MGIDISRRMWDRLNERVSKMEGKIRTFEVKIDNMERRIKPQEILRSIHHYKKDMAASDNLELSPKFIQE